MKNNLNISPIATPRRAWGGVGAALVLLLTACSPSTNKTDAADGHADGHTESTATVELTERQMKTVGINLGPLEQRNLGAAVRANGDLRLNPQDRATVTPLVGGVVRRLLVTEGQPVSRGQVVAYIENTDLVALQRDLLTATRELDFARQELERQRLLKAERAGVEKTLQQAQANYGVAEAKVSGLRQQLQQLGIRPGSGQMQRQIAICAPISGTVTRIAANTGSYADPQTPLMDIANNRAVYAALRVFEKDLSRVARGQRVDIALTYQQDTHIQGTVLSVSQTIDTESRSAVVRVGLNAAQKAGRLLGEGMTVTGMISTDRQQTEALPDEAIVQQGGRKYVYTLDHKAQEDGQAVCHFRRVEVVTGQSELGHTAVSFPTPPARGTLFVRSGAFYLASAAADHGEHSH